MKLDFTITFPYGFRIGAGNPPHMSYLPDPVFRRGGKIAIPGSTFKGILRKAACIFFNKIFNTLETPPRSCEPSELEKFWKAGKTPVFFSLFGVPKYKRGKIQVLEGVPVDSNVRTWIKPGCGINRKTGIVEEGHLFHREFVCPGSSFRFQIAILEPLSEEEWKMLLGSAYYSPRIGLGTGSVPFTLKLETEIPVPRQAEEFYKSLRKGVGI